MSAEPSPRIWGDDHAMPDERSVLGGCLLDPSQLDGIPSLRPEDFYLDGHRDAYTVLRALRDAGQPITTSTVCDELEARGWLERVGGLSGVVSWSEAAATGATVRYHAERVHRAAAQRWDRLAGEAMRAVMTRPGRTSEQRLAEVRALVAQREARAWAPTAARPVADELGAWLRRSGRPAVPPVSLGIPALDHYVAGGLRPGELAIIGGRPGVGKTAFVLALAGRATVPTLVFSLEMGGSALFERWLAAEASVPLSAVRAPDVRSASYERAVAAAGRVAERPVWVDDTASLSIAALGSRARALHATAGLRLVIVDYLQLVRGERGESRAWEVASVTQGLKALARELGLPVVAACQLNRQAEGRGGESPRLSDLRESGAIEQDADVVILLHRPAEPAGAPTAAQVAKNRNGETGRTSLEFDPVRVSFHAAMRAAS